MGKTIAEKILSKTCGREVIPGEIVYPNPDLAVLPDYQVFHDGVSIAEELKQLGLSKAAQPEKYMISLDHTMPVSSVVRAEAVKRIRETVAELGIKYFFDEGEHGIEQYIPIEKGLARPGMLVFGCDQIANVGAVGALGICIPYGVLTIVATGTHWIKVPRTIKVELAGSLPKGVVARDVILWILHDIGGERGNYRVLEFTGPGVKNIGIDGRTTLCNYIIHIGAKSGIVEPDERTIAYVKSRTTEPFEVVRSDPDADFEQVFHYNLAKLEPVVALPRDPADDVRPVTALAGTKIHQASIGSCANGGLDDLRIAAQVVKGRQVHSGVRMIVTPATQEIFKGAVREGIIETLLTARVAVTEPSCGTCGGSFGSLAAGETCIATITRNDPGRMGSPEAEIYLASPATVAASAIKGEIADPREFL